MSTTKETVSATTTTEATTKTSGSSVAKRKTQSKEDMLIDQVRNELESYFAPQNIQNDFNLRQKMTSDGYINIDILLDLKLISDLATNRDVLVSAIAKSKLLKMNTARTMVKYMPLLERKTLILRDIATSTKKEQIIGIFTESTQCCVPLEVHSDIGNNWFCSFQTEDECLATAKYLQQFGTFNDKKLHVRVKAIHDVKKADASPSMTVPSASSSNKKSKVESGAAPLYSPSGGYYATPNYGFYGGGAPAMDPYAAQFGGGGGGGGVASTAKDIVKTEKVVEDRTAISDYPGDFDKYSQETFLKIYSEMDKKDLLIPQSMRGRDVRIVSEGILVPKLIASDSDNEDDDADRQRKRNRKRNTKRRRGRGRGRGGGRGRGRGRERKGMYYEDDMYGGGGGGDANGYYGQYEDEYFYDDGGYYGGGRYYDDNDGYYEQQQDDGYYAAEQSNGRRNRSKPRGGRGRGRASARGKAVRGQGRREETTRKYNSRRRGGGGQAAKNAKPSKVWAPKDAKPKAKSSKAKKPKVEVAKVRTYSTKKGVYARKAVAAN